MSQITTQDIEYRDLIQQFSSSSTGKEEIDIMEINKRLLSTWAWKRLYLYRSLFPKLEIDLSSIGLYFEIKNETFPKHMTTEEISEEDLFSEMLEHDFIVKMPPKRRYSIELSIKNIRRGEPKIFDIEEIGGK
jgi:hypothetical protein